MPYENFEYMQMPIKLLSQSFTKQYDLWQKAKDGFDNIGIRKCIYGLPQAGILANQLIKKSLAN